MNNNVINTFVADMYNFGQNVCIAYMQYKLVLELATKASLLYALQCV